MSTTGSTRADGPSMQGTGEGGAASPAVGQAKEKAQQTVQKAAGEARGRVREQVDQRSTQAGEQVASSAGDVRSVAQQFREQGKEQPAKLAEQAADRAEQVGDYLKRSDGDTILRDLEDFGRRQPWAVMFGGLAAGFLASRFLKASSSRRYEQRYVGEVTTGPDRAPSTIRPPATAVPAVPAAADAPPVPRRPETGVEPGGRPVRDPVSWDVVPETPGAVPPGRKA
jgi:vacuolar-type H+-ATPase subunit H